MIIAIDAADFMFHNARLDVDLMEIRHTKALPTVLNGQLVQGERGRILDTQAAL